MRPVDDDTAAMIRRDLAEAEKQRRFRRRVLIALFLLIAFFFTAVYFAPWPTAVSR